MKSRISAGRPADRKNQIEAHLRDQIVMGPWGPGSRLPNRAEIEQQFGTGPGTVQAALASLARDGFILSRGSKGTFVTPNPPHLSRYALVFPHHPVPNELGHWARFWTALTQEALAVEKTGVRRLPAYYGVDGHADSEDFVQLVRDVEAHRLAGLIFTSRPSNLQHTPLLEHAGIPRVALTSASFSGVPTLALDQRSFLEKALKYLASRGRNKVAIMMTPRSWSSLNVTDIIAENGMETRPYWLQRINLMSPETARECAHLLMKCRDEPDSLIIADDNIVEYATSGLVSAGVRVPEELEIVAHCNFPYPTPSVLPVQRLGFDARSVLTACLDLIDRQRRGETVADFTLIPAYFEEELSR